jgi:chromosome segregation ATPase
MDDIKVLLGIAAIIVSWVTAIVISFVRKAKWEATITESINKFNEDLEEIKGRVDGLEDKIERHDIHNAEIQKDIASIGVAIQELSFKYEKTEERIIQAMYKIGTLDGKSTPLTADNKKG